MNIGDIITTEDELDALPVGTVLHAQSPNVPARCDVWVRWPYGWRTDGLREPEGRPTGYLPMTVLALPGRPPRPERVVKAEALREAAESHAAQERARKRVEDELVEWRDSGLFEMRNNGLAIKYADGSPGNIRFGFEHGYRLALLAEADRTSHMAGDL